MVTKDLDALEVFNRNPFGLRRSKLFCLEQSNYLVINFSSSIFLTAPNILMVSAENGTHRIYTLVECDDNIILWPLGFLESDEWFLLS